MKWDVCSKDKAFSYKIGMFYRYYYLSDKCSWYEFYDDDCRKLSERKDFGPSK